MWTVCGTVDTHSFTGRFLHSWAALLEKLSDDDMSYSSVRLNFRPFPSTYLTKPFVIHKALCNSVISHIQRNPPTVLYMSFLMVDSPSRGQFSDETVPFFAVHWQVFVQSNLFCFSSFSPTNPQTHTPHTHTHTLTPHYCTV